MNVYGDARNCYKEDARDSVGVEFREYVGVYKRVFRSPGVGSVMFATIIFVWSRRWAGVC